MNFFNVAEADNENQSTGGRSLLLAAARLNQNYYARMGQQRVRIQRASCSVPRGSILLRYLDDPEWHHGRNVRRAHTMHCNFLR